MSSSSATARKRTNIIRVIGGAVILALVAGAVLAGIGASGALAPQVQGVIEQPAQAQQYARIVTLWDSAAQTIDNACTAQLTSAPTTDASASYPAIAADYALAWADAEATGLGIPAGYPVSLPVLPAPVDFCEFASALKSDRA